MKRKAPTPWLECDVKALRKLSPHYTDEVLARVFGRTVPAISGKAQLLGLFKSAAYLRAYRESTQFKPGQKPWNTGTNYKAGGRSAETRFKPGNKPHTTLPVGSRRIDPDGYLQIKVSEASGNPNLRWHGVHRVVWEAANGPTPEGHVVVFKPGRRTTVEADITLDAVELITRRELMARNTIHNLPAPLVEVIQLRNALNRRVKNRQREEA